MILTQKELRDECNQVYWKRIATRPPAWLIKILTRSENELPKMRRENET